MRRQYISLEEIADYKNLLTALYKASKAKRNRPVVQDFHYQLDRNLSSLSRDIMAGKLPYGRFKTFEIHDPKKRLIHAACFEDRVFHHAVMNIAGERLEKSMIYHSYACRPGKGVHKAIETVRKNLQRFKWFVKIDIASYFSQIDHAILLNLLKCRFKGSAFVGQLSRIISNCPDMVEKGLPIGSLTSQYFANYYLDGFDRFLSNHTHVLAMARYMDDVIWWCDSRNNAETVLTEAVDYLREKRLLSVKSDIQIQPSRVGVTYCGFRILQGVVRLSRRRKKALKQRRQYWEGQYKKGKISDLQLQTAYAAVHAIAQGADSLAWRQNQLQNKVPTDV